MSRQELADDCNAELARRYRTGGRIRRWAGFTEKVIGALERGEIRWPNEDYRAALCAVLKADERTLGLYIDRPAEASDENGFRAIWRWPVSHRGADPSGAPDMAHDVAEWLSTRSAQSASVDNSISTSDHLARIDAARAHFEHMYRRVGGILARPRIEAFLRELIVPPTLSRQHARRASDLVAATARLVAIAGVCCYDAEQHARAQYHFGRALNMAAESGDKALSSYVRALMANQALCIGQPGRAIDHIDVALSRNRPFLSPALLTDLLVMKAKCYAHLGSRSECLHYIHAAEDAYGRFDPRHEPSETGYVHSGLLELKSVEALLQIGDLVEARLRAESLLAHGSANPRSDVYAQATLSMVCAARRQADESVSWAMKAFDNALGMESWRIRGRLDLMLKALLPFGGEKRVKEVLSAYLVRDHYSTTGPML